VKVLLSLRVIARLPGSMPKSLLDQLPKIVAEGRATARHGAR
jgi:hypothetical protein